MKKIILSVFTIVLVHIGYAQPPVGPANPGDTYGQKIDANGIVPVADLSESLKKADTVETKVTGKVLNVCPKKGCWMEVELDDKRKMFVKFKDYGFFVPMNLVGKSIVVDGIAFNKTTSVNELKHYAKDAKKTQAEIDAITEPKMQMRFLADGVLVVK